MEVEFSGDRRRRRLLLLSGGLLALVTAAVIVYFLQPAPAVPLPVATRTVVVAAVAIPARSVIGASMLTTADLPVSAILDSVLTDPTEAIGKVTAVGILKNQLIAPNLYGSGSLGGLAILSADETISPDSPVWRAISVLVPKERSVGGMLVPGEHVDLFTTIKLAVYDPSGGQANGALPSSGYYSENTTKLMWSDIEILAYDVGEDLFILKVDEHQAEEIAHIQGSDLNGFSLSLRPEADTRDIDRSGYGETTNRILEQYDFPVPQIIDLNGYPQPAAQPSPFSNLPWGATPAPTLAATPVPSPSPEALPSAAPSNSPKP